MSSSENVDGVLSFTTWHPAGSGQGGEDVVVVDGKFDNVSRPMIFVGCELSAVNSPRTAERLLSEDKDADAARSLQTDMDPLASCLEHRMRDSECMTELLLCLGQRQSVDVDRSRHG